MTADSLWVAFALVLVMEGLLPFLSPERWRRAMAHIAKLPDHHIRLYGLLAILVGLAVLWV